MRQCKTRNLCRFAFTQISDHDREHPAQKKHAEDERTKEKAHRAEVRLDCELTQREMTFQLEALDPETDAREYGERHDLDEKRQKCRKFAITACQEKECQESQDWSCKPNVGQCGKRCVET